MTILESMILEAKIILLKDEIVEIASRLVKQDDQPRKGGMVEVPYHFLDQLDAKLHELGNLEMQIKQRQIDNL